MTQNPRKIDPKLNTNTPNASQAETIALKSAQVVKDINPNGNDMLQTGDAPPNMPTKRKRGRPTKYKAVYCQQIIAFFNRSHIHKSKVIHTNSKGKTWVAFETKANPVPLMCDFAEYLNTDVETLWNWKKMFPKFSKASTHAQALQLRHLATVTGLGLYNANWAVFMAKNISKWRDKKDIEHSGGIGIDLLVDKMVDSADSATSDFKRVAQHAN